jgi:hypothetical protein
MKNIIAASIVIASTVFAGGAFAAQDTSAQPYIWTNGEAGLIVNSAYKSTAAVDKSEGILLVGIGENEAKVNPKFPTLPNMKHTALFKAGVGEVSLVEIAPVAAQMVASR